jgi:ketosteroid isomerase-like protein
MQPVLEAVHEYYKAFSTLDLTAIASHYSEPCLTVAAQGVFSAPNRAALADSLAPLVQSLRSNGYGRSEFVQPNVSMLGEADALVRGVAVRYTAAGSELERVPLSYLMHRSEAGWKIAVLVAEKA